MAPDWSCSLELLREMDLLCFCLGMGSHRAGAVTLPQPSSPVLSVCVPESFPPSPAAHQLWGAELDTTASLCSPPPPCFSLFLPSTGILGTFKNQMYGQGPPGYTVPGVQAPAHKPGPVLLCVHGEFACTDPFYWPCRVCITDKLGMYHVTLWLQMGLFYLVFNTENMPWLCMRHKN